MVMTQLDNQVSKKEEFMTLQMCYKESAMLKKYTKTN